MIISASYRTDIPAFYGDWFQRRLDAGFCQVLNPYSHQLSTVPLDPDHVEGFVFWTKNIGPFLPVLADVSARGWPFVVQHTLTGYPRALEARVPAVSRALAALRTVAETYGPRVVVWRYDPIVLSSLTPEDWHRTQFARLATALEGVTDEVTVSFLQVYAKTARRLAQAPTMQGVTWDSPTVAAQRTLLTECALIAKNQGMRLTLCTQPALAGIPGTSPARCVDLERLSDVAGRPLTGKTHGNRPGCLCAASVDIGAYDSCPHGCVYCYAVNDDARARRAFHDHDPAHPFLVVPTGTVPVAPSPPANLVLPLD